MKRAPRFLAAAIAWTTCAVACDFDAAYDAWCANDASCAGAGGAGGGTGGAGGFAPIELAPPAACADSAACGANERCHPLGHVCMTACVGDADCPPEEPRCVSLAELAGGPATERVCTCTSTRTCADAGPGARCSPIDDRCEPACATSADCTAYAPERVCDDSSSLCVLAASR